MVGELRPEEEDEISERKSQSSSRLGSNNDEDALVNL